MDRTGFTDIVVRNGLSWEIIRKEQVPQNNNLVDQFEPQQDMYVEYILDVSDCDLCSLEYVCERCVENMEALIRAGRLAPVNRRLSGKHNTNHQLLPIFLVNKLVISSNYFE